MTTYIISEIVRRRLAANASDRFPSIASYGDLHQNLKGDIFEYLENDGWTPLYMTESVTTPDVPNEIIDIEYEEIDPKKLSR